MNVLTNLLGNLMLFSRNAPSKAFFVGQIVWLILLPEVIVGFLSFS